MAERAYIGTKVIMAEPMTNYEFAAFKKQPTTSPEEPGYKVRYPDGYISWSPKEVFEEAYRLVTPKEMGLINGEGSKVCRYGQ